MYFSYITLSLIEVSQYKNAMKYNIIQPRPMTLKSKQFQTYSKNWYNTQAS